MWPTSRGGVVLLAFLAIAALLLVTERTAHLLGVLPYVLLLLCPLLHLLHHGGHDGHAGPGSVSDGDEHHRSGGP